MENEQVFKLIDAGFTAEEIRGMGFQVPGKEEAAGGSVPDEQGKADPAHEGEVNAEESDEIRELKASIKELNATVKAIQDANIKKAEGSGPASVRDQIAENIKSFTENF